MVDLSVGVVNQPVGVVNLPVGVVNLPVGCGESGATRWCGESGHTSYLNGYRLTGKHLVVPPEYKVQVRAEVPTVWPNQKLCLVLFSSFRLGKEQTQ